MTAPRVWYFGVQPGTTSGHYISSRDCPIGSELDGSFTPVSRSIGWYAVHWLMGLTVVAFHDQSGDKRSGSNSAFVVEGYVTEREVFRLARARFPGVFERFEQAYPGITLKYHPTDLFVCFNGHFNTRTDNIWSGLICTICHDKRSCVKYESPVVGEGICGRCDEMRLLFPNPHGAVARCAECRKLDDQERGS